MVIARIIRSNMKEYSDRDILELREYLDNADVPQGGRQIYPPLESKLIFAKILEYPKCKP